MLGLLVVCFGVNGKQEQKHTVVLHNEDLRIMRSLVDWTIDINVTTFNVLILPCVIMVIFGELTLLHKYTTTLLTFWRDCCFTPTSSAHDRCLL